MQVVEVFKDDAARQSWLFAKLADLIDEGDVIVFAGQIARVDALAAQLQAAGVRAGAIHGDMDQVGTWTRAQSPSLSPAMHASMDPCM